MSFLLPMLKFQLKQIIKSDYPTVPTPPLFHEQRVLFGGHLHTVVLCGCGLREAFDYALVSEK